MKNNVLVNGYRCGKLERCSHWNLGDHLFGPIDFFTPDIWTETLKKNVCSKKIVFEKNKNTGENRSQHDVLKVILGDFGQDTTRKPKFSRVFRGDTSREIEDSV